jgi:predicted lipoprotein with Yx(FWY)xxD motif
MIRSIRLSTAATASAALVLITLTTACASANTSAPAAPAEIQVVSGVLAGKNGMTLYTFDKDTAGSGKSVCNGPCATNWPPLMAGQMAPSGDYSAITRDDGQRQIAYKGKPLYFWTKDMKPGDTTGNGVNSVWRTATP